MQFWEYNFVPDITQQAENPKVCTQDLDNIDIPREYTKLFKHHFYSVNLNMIPACIKSYETLGVKHEPLTLIPPHFEAPLPPTQASVSITYLILYIFMIAHVIQTRNNSTGISSELPRITSACFGTV